MCCVPSFAKYFTGIILLDSHKKHEASTIHSLVLQTRKLSFKQLKYWSISKQVARSRARLEPREPGSKTTTCTLSEAPWEAEKPPTTVDLVLWILMLFSPGNGLQGCDFMSMMLWVACGTRRWVQLGEGGEPPNNLSHMMLLSLYFLGMSWCLDWAILVSLEFYLNAQWKARGSREISAAGANR